MKEVQRIQRDIAGSRTEPATAAPSTSRIDAASTQPRANLKGKIRR